MIFDLFHSISDPIVRGTQLGSRASFENAIEQARLAESLGFDTFWMAESHFSSETQKKTSVATVQGFEGEVGLNSDSYQWFHVLQRATSRIGLGTGIHNIVGGSGGPIASADRVNTLRFINEHIWDSKRLLRMGVASGRFPYQNDPFGLVPRNSLERDLWPILKRFAFVEALEIFLRLLRGEELSSALTTVHEITAAMVDREMPGQASRLRLQYQFPLVVPKRWTFEVLKLVPECTSEKLRIVLGSSDPLALEVGNRFWDLDLFNLSFTPPDQIEKLHGKLSAMHESKGTTWERSRLPRTVLIFIDRDPRQAMALASDVFDTYIEAMKGTAATPDKSILLERALIGDASEIREQLHPDNPRGFHKDDRLMCWFEFNQLDSAAICSRMKYFYDEVMTKL